jgi:hypothetical protein
MLQCQDSIRNERWGKVGPCLCIKSGPWDMGSHGLGRHVSPWMILWSRLLIPYISTISCNPQSLASNHSSQMFYVTTTLCADFTTWILNHHSSYFLLASTELQRNLKNSEQMDCCGLCLIFLCSHTHWPNNFNVRVKIWKLQCCRRRDLYHQVGQIQQPL